MQNLEYIDSFFQNELKPEETLLFEKRIAEDPEFAEDVAFYLSAQQIIRDELAEDKKRRFKDIYEQPEQREKGVLRSIGTNRALIAAAAVIVCIVAGIYLFNQPPISQRLAENYLQTELHDLRTTMGSQDDLQKGVDLYNHGNYTEAIRQFNKVMEAEPSNYQAKQYAGISYLRLKDYDQALFYFKQVENLNLHANPNKFYHALTLLERNQPGDIQLAKELLNQVVKEDMEQKQVAQEWLQKL